MSTENSFSYSESYDEILESGSVTSAPKSGKAINCAKKWIFTFNLMHFTDEEKEVIYSSLESALQKECLQYAVQLETGENGNLHLQGAINLKVKKRPFSKGDKRCLFPLLQGAHWEVCRDWKKACDYCQKDETFSGKRWLFNVAGKNLFFGGKSKLLIILQLFLEGLLSNSSNRKNSDPGKKNCTILSKTQVSNLTQEKLSGFGILKEGQANPHLQKVSFVNSLTKLLLLMERRMTYTIASTGIQSQIQRKVQLETSHELCSGTFLNAQQIIFELEL